MKKRSEIKKSGKHSLKKHYLIFIAACLIASFLGSEFSGTLNISSSKDPVQAVRPLKSRLRDRRALECIAAKLLFLSKNRRSDGLLLCFQGIKISRHCSLRTELAACLDRF